MRSIGIPLLALLAAQLSCRSAMPPAGAASAAATALAAPAPETWKRTPPPPPLPRWSSKPATVRELYLKTGLRVVVVEQHRRPVVVIRLVFPRGALTESEENAGATQLAVTLASDYYEQKDTSDDPLFEEKSFRRQVVELGGSAWFDVESDYSVAGISGYAVDAGKYLSMLAEAVMHPRHGEQSFAARRDQLLDAIEDIESSDPEALSRVLASSSFGAGHPYARSTIGTLRSLGRLGLENVVSQQRLVFVPAGATLLVVGDVKAERALAEAREVFQRWRGESPPLPPVDPRAVASGVAEVGFLRRQPASTLAVCASRPLSDVREREAALEVLSALLGQGSQSRLMASLRDGNGLTYGASAQIIRRKHARAFLACSALKADQADLGIRIFRQTLDGVRAARPSGQELERAKAVRLAELESAYDDAFGASSTWLEAIVLGGGQPRLEEERAELERVTADDVQAVAQSVLRPDTLRWIVSGDPKIASRAVEANRLGRLRALALER